MRPRAARIGLLLMLVLGIGWGIAHAADGDLDPTFDTDGRVTADFHNTGDDARAVALQPDGKIVLAGFTVPDGSPTNFGLMRLHPDGTQDDSFDGDGKLSTDFFGGVDEVRAVAIQPDGKIVAIGNAQVSGNNYDFALARYNSNGDLDDTFDSDGKATTDFFGGDDGAYATALQPDGKVVAAGAFYTTSAGYDFGLARFHADGSLDTSFDNDGLQAINFAAGTAEEVGLGMVLQADRKVVVAGYAPGEGGVNDFALVRLNEDGSLDGSFGTGGRLTHDFGGGVALAYGVAIQADGKIVAAGTAYMGDTNHYDFAVARYVLGDLPTPTPTATATPPPRHGYLPLVLK